MPLKYQAPTRAELQVSGSVHVDGKLYFMRLDPDGIVYYNMTTRVWKQILIPAPPRLSDHTLAECGGKLSACGACEQWCFDVHLHMGAAEDDFLVEAGRQNANPMVLGVLREASRIGFPV
ncbi:Uncharacterized protein Fot_33992 [Forsythia ovata]|uniref:F-box protein n=1 Tax=Forsythia ovata TaxID=205694 RepID=A0ABD1TC94_9LAMI